MTASDYRIAMGRSDHSAAVRIYKRTPVNHWLVVLHWLSWLVLALMVGLYGLHTGRTYKGVLFLLSIPLAAIALIQALRYRIVLAQDYIERRKFSVTRLRFDEITSVLLLDDSLTISTLNSSIHIHRSTRNRQELFGTIVKRLRECGKANIPGLDELIAAYPPR